MASVLSQFARAADHPREWLLEWKARTGKKVIGCFPLYGPEELIHASGMLPVLLQGSDKPIALASQHLHANVCHPVRTNFDQALRGEMDFMDGLVVSDVCEQAKRCSSMWKLYHHLPYHHNLIYPKVIDSGAAPDYLVYELKRCKASLEHFTGRPIPEGAIKQSIALYNRTRSLLSQLYQRRREKPESFTTEEMAQVMAASQVMPKEEFNPLLEGYLRQRRGVAARDERVPILLACNQCEDVEPGLAQMMEGAGALVVDDDLYFGYRYLVPSVGETGDPIGALAQAHLNLPPCPTRHHPGRPWGEFMIGRAKAAGAKGVVLILQQFCEIHGFEYPSVRDRFKEAELPLLMLESDHSGATGRVKTRLEAFLEMIKEKEG